VRRCLVLGRALSESGWSVRFASAPGAEEAVPGLKNLDAAVIALPIASDEAELIRDAIPGGCDLLVVDHYRRDANFESRLRDWTKRILVIDDLADRSHDCDVLVDQTPGRNQDDYRALVPAPCQILAGSDYALLDPRFAARRSGGRRRSGEVKRIVVSLGTTDPGGATALVIDALKELDIDASVDVVVGAASPHRAAVERAVGSLSPPGRVFVDVDDMASLLAGADLVIGGGGVSALERCCLGIPSLLLILAGNQRGNAAELERVGAALVLDEPEWRQPSALVQAIRELAADLVGLSDMSRAAAAVVDGMGVRRVLAFCRPQSDTVMTHAGKGRVQ